MQAFLDIMRERGLIAQITHEEEFAEHLQQKRCAYIGFDPTADSLHAGSLLPIMVLAHFQRCGHRVVAVVGGGTAMVGDPSGKTELRQMLTPEDIENNKTNIKKQIGRFIDFSDPQKGIMVDNADWLLGLNYLTFLRDIGKHFSVNRMLTAECFKQRLEKGLSFLEFNYMLLQAYDYLHLFEKQNCTVQLGGDDQWSNILAGTDLIRRVKSAASYCMTFPLLTTQDGRKMGKTEKGAVWLSGEKTSPYEYYQFWRNIDDSMVNTCLKFFTYLPVPQIDEFTKAGGSALNDAKKLLAFETTKLLHGEAAAEAAQKKTQGLFSGSTADMADTPVDFQFSKSELDSGIQLLDALVTAGIIPTKSEGKRLISQGGIVVNERKVTELGEKLKLEEFIKSPSGDLFCVIKKGKKSLYKLGVKS